MNLLDKVKLIRGSSEGTLDLGGAAAYTACADMADGHSVLWLWQFSSDAGIKGSTGVRFFLAASSSTGGSFTNLSTGTWAYRSTVPIPSLNHRLVAIDVVKPTMSSSLRYLKMGVVGCTGHCEAIGIQYGLHVVGTSQAYASTWICGTTRLVGAASST
jgi:hypothetical protein